MTLHTKYPVRRCLHCFLICCLFLPVFLSGCAPSSSLVRVSDIELQDDGPARVWPPPPQTPRIRFAASITGPSDIAVKKSWFRQTIDTLFGREEFEDSMLRPYGVYSRGTRIYVTDPGFGLVHIFDSGKQEYSRIAKGDEDVLISPIGIAAEPDGTIYVSDSVLRKVFVYDMDGVLLRTIGSPELLVRPSGIAVHADRVYVVDTHRHQVLAFDKTRGDLLLRFGKNGSAKGDFNFPTNIFITAEGLLFVTDSLNFRIQSFSSEGVFLGAFGKHGDGSGDFSKPKGIALDSEGHVYVADAHFDNVQIFDQKGTFLLSFGNPGRAKGEMLLPAGLFIDEDDRVYVADSYNRRVQVFQYLREPQQGVMVK